MEDSESVPVGSPVGQNEPPVPTGSHTQPSGPIGDKNRIGSLGCVLRANGYWWFILSYGRVPNPSRAVFVGLSSSWNPIADVISINYSRTRR
jgi:hypothetical protein